jgi:hypothetical protein
MSQYVAIGPLVNWSTLGAGQKNAPTAAPRAATRHPRRQPAEWGITLPNPRLRHIVGSLSYPGQRPPPRCCDLGEDLTTERMELRPMAARSFPENLAFDPPQREPRQDLSWREKLHRAEGQATTCAISEPRLRRDLAFCFSA